jgi:hypothetical protein
VERRLAFLEARQKEYDEYNARARRPPRAGAVGSDRDESEADFVRKLDRLLGSNELKDRAAGKVAMHEAMVRQKAQSRHFDWVKKVYEPISTKVVQAVESNFERIHAQRQGAMAEFLGATAARGGVFLDDLIKADDYDPYKLNRTAGLRAHVDVVDPLKRVVDKTWEERELVRRETFRKSRVKGMLDPREYTDLSIEATMTGHFEIKDLQGGVVMAFAGKDNESSVRVDMDFDAPRARDARNRDPAVDAEFPIGKRMRVHITAVTCVFSCAPANLLPFLPPLVPLSCPNSLAYPYNFTDTSGVVKLQSQSTGVYAPGEKYSDAGGTRLDSTRPDIVLETMRSEQAATGRSTLGATPKGAARPSKSGDIMPAIGGFGSTNAIRFG